MMGGVDVGMDSDSGCMICGSCWWVDCKNSADYRMDVDLKRNGKQIYSGDVDLCAGHARLVHANGGRMDLNWKAIEQARAFIKAKA